MMDKDWAIAGFMVSVIVSLIALTSIVLDQDGRIAKLEEGIKNTPPKTTAASEGVDR